MNADEDNKGRFLFSSCFQASNCRSLLSYKLSVIDFTLLGSILAWKLLGTKGKLHIIYEELVVKTMQLIFKNPADC